MTAWSLSLSLSGPAAHTPVVHAFGSFHPRYYTMRYDTPDTPDVTALVRRGAGAPEPCRTANRSTSTPA